MTNLIRAVGFWGLVAMCINAVVGSGVYLLPTESFRLLGPFSLWAPLIFALPVFILVLCFAEAAAHFSEPGGAYLYARTAFGDFIGFETGFMNVLARISSLAALSNGFVMSLARLWPDAALPGTRAILIIATILLFATIHTLGIRYGARTIYLFTIGKMLPLLGFTIIAIALFRNNPIPASFTIPGTETRWNEAALLLLFAYAGFENLGVPAGEYKNPRRDLPLALLVGTLAIAATYSLVQLAAMASLPDLSATQTPIADAASAILGTFGAWAVSIGAILSILGTNLGTILEGSRMVFALSGERRPFTLLARIHRTFHTPYFAIALFVAIAIPLALAGSFAKLALLSAVARLTTYLFTSASLPFIRRKFGLAITAKVLILSTAGTAISLLLYLTLGKQQFVAASIALGAGAALWLTGRILSGPRVVECETDGV